MLSQQTREYIQGLSDDNLSEYVAAGTTMYDPDAVAFAEETLSQRGLPAERISELAAASQVRLASRAAEIAEIQNRPLTATGRIIAFFGGCLGLPLLFFLFTWVRLESRGERRKVRELWKFGFLGFASIVAFALIVTFFHGQ